MEHTKHIHLMEVPNADKSNFSGAYHSFTVVVGITLLVHALVCWILLNPHGPAPLLDEPVYISLAKSLATRGEYRSIFLPGEPYHTKYPILYPWIISWVWKASPDFPQNVLYLRLFSLALSLSALGVLVLMLRQLASNRHYLGVTVLAVFALHPAFIANSAAISSEPAYMLFSFLGLFLTLKQESTARPVWNSMLTGIALALAIYVRTVGVALFVAIVLYQLLLRRWNRLLVTSLTVVSLLAPWVYWSHTHDESIRYPEYIYSTNYVMDFWQLIQARGLLSVLSKNMLYLAFGIPKTILYPYQSDLHSLTLLTAWVGFPTLVLLSISSYRNLRGWNLKMLPGQIYLACYCGILLFWPYQTGERFLLPILPLLLWILLTELFEIRSRAATHLAQLEGPIRKFGQIVFTSLALAIVSLWMGILVYHELRFFKTKHDEVNTYRAQERARIETCAWIRRETNPADSLMAYLNPVYYLYTNHQTAPIMFDPGLELTLPRFLVEPIRKHEIKYMVVGDLDFGVYTPDIVAAMSREIHEVIQGKYGMHFQRVFSSADGKCEVYRISDERPASRTIKESENESHLPLLLKWSIVEAAFEQREKN